MPLVGNGTPPQPPTCRLVCPLPPVSGGRGTLAGEKGVGRVPIPTKGIHCGTLYMYVLCGQRPLSGVHSIMMVKSAQPGKGWGMGYTPSPFSLYLPQWSRRLECWPNTADNLAGWRRVIRQVWFCMWWTAVPPLFSVRYWLPWQELPSCELMEFPAAVIL